MRPRRRGGPLDCADIKLLLTTTANNDNNDNIQIIFAEQVFLTARRKGVQTNKTIYIYIYIYIEREREISICMLYIYICVYVYIYIYIYIYIHKQFVLFPLPPAAPHRSGSTILFCTASCQKSNLTNGPSPKDSLTLKGRVEVNIGNGSWI